MSVLTFVCCLEHYFLACLRYSSATFLFSALPQLHDESQSHRDVLKATSPSALSRNATTTTATTGSDRYAVFPPGDFNEAMAKARHMDSQDLSRDPNSGRKARLQNSTSTLGASTNSSRGRSPSRGGYYGAQMRNYSPSASSVASSDSRAGGGIGCESSGQIELKTGSSGAPKNSIPLVGPVMTYPTFHAPETPFGPHFNTFLARVETCGHRASYEMHDVHDVHSLVVIIILCVLYQPGTQVQRSATYTTVAALLHPYPYCVY